MKKQRILIPLVCYNYGRFLPLCLDSILNQTCKNWTVVLRDLQSSDNTEEVMKKYVKMDPRIHYVREKRLTEQFSIPKALNKTISENPGFEIIVNQDVDDAMMPRRLELSIKKLRSGDIVYGNAQLFGSKSSLYKSWPYVNFQLLRQNNRIIASTASFKSYVWKAINGFDEDPNVFNVYDYDFWLRASKMGFKFKYINQPITWYRVHSDSIGQKFAKKQELAATYVRKKHQETSIPTKILVFLCSFLEACTQPVLFYEIRNQLFFGKTSDGLEFVTVDDD